jgi:hypothetical protein
MASISLCSMGFAIFTIGHATDGKLEKENWKHYLEVNLLFANKIHSLYREGCYTLISRRSYLDSRLSSVDGPWYTSQVITNGNNRLLFAHSVSKLRIISMPSE